METESSVAYMTELDLAIEDVRKGDLHTFESVDDLMTYLNS